MKKIILSLLISVFTSWSAFAATDTIPWDKAPNKINDLGALQNGAKLFVNYCLNCHAAAYMRFNRLTDIGLTEQQIKDNLLFTTDKVGETMKITMDPKQAKDWFGGNPPSTLICAVITETQARPLVGTTSPSPMSACRMCCGNCKASANRCSTRWHLTAMKPRCSKAGNRYLPANSAPQSTMQRLAIWSATCSGCLIPHKACASKLAYG